MCPVSPAKLLSLNAVHPTSHLQRKISTKSLYYAPSLDRARFQLGTIGYPISLGCRTRLCCGTLLTSHPSRIGWYSRFVAFFLMVLNPVPARTAPECTRTPSFPHLHPTYLSILVLLWCSYGFCTIEFHSVWNRFSRFSFSFTTLCIGAAAVFPPTKSFRSSARFPIDWLSLLSFSQRLSFSRIIASGSLLRFSIPRRYWLANCVLQCFATRFSTDSSLSFAVDPAQNRLFDVLSVLQQLNSKQEIGQFVSQTKAMTPIEILYASLYLVSFEEWELAPLLVCFCVLFVVVSHTTWRLFSPLAAAKLGRTAHNGSAMQPLLALLLVGAVQSGWASGRVCGFGDGRCGVCLDWNAWRCVEGSRSLRALDAGESHRFCVLAFDSLSVSRLRIEATIGLFFAAAILCRNARDRWTLWKGCGTHGAKRTERTLPGGFGAEIAFHRNESGHRVEHFLETNTSPIGMINWLFVKIKLEKTPMLSSLLVNAFNNTGINPNVPSRDASITQNFNPSSKSLVIDDRSHAPFSIFKMNLLRRIVIHIKLVIVRR